MRKQLYGDGRIVHEFQVLRPTPAGPGPLSSQADAHC